MQNKEYNNNPTLFSWNRTRAHAHTHDFATLDAATSSNSMIPLVLE